MKKKKILKIVLIIIAILIALFIVHTVRNYVIITNLQKQVSKYQDSTNYHIKSMTTESNGTVITMEYYRKDNKEALFLESNLNGEISKISVYNNGERTDTFFDTKEEKVAQLDSGNMMSVHIVSYIETANNWHTFLESMRTNIKSTKYNGKECYIIKGFLSIYSPGFEVGETYIEKDTGLFVKTIENGRVGEREYEFNTIEDSIFVEPDISQYKLK